MVAQAVVKAGLEAIAKAESAVADGVDADAFLASHILPLANASGTIALIVPDKKVAIGGGPVGEATIQATMFAFDGGGGGIDEARGHLDEGGAFAFGGVPVFLTDEAGDGEDIAVHVLDGDAFFEFGGDAIEDEVSGGIGVGNLGVTEKVREAEAESFVAFASGGAIFAEESEETVEARLSHLAAPRRTNPAQ